MRNPLCILLGHRWLSTGWWEEHTAIGNWHRNLKCSRCGQINAMSARASSKPLDTC